MDGEVTARRRTRAIPSYPPPGVPYRSPAIEAPVHQEDGLRPSPPIRGRRGRVAKRSRVAGSRPARPAARYTTPGALSNHRDDGPPPRPLAAVENRAFSGAPARRSQKCDRRTVKVASFKFPPNSFRSSHVKRTPRFRRAVALYEM
ncbi:hypothetical protein EVAR_22259_1 [Eumeta japonica]|uniref:Uncharacterized protein n=1 Tax=Eumeta variegata TaxID=151549 RepID=A0A4C1UAK0_EUMVA|nr:hypothetical protein EVAR_22259_1 [Eumeta japonica]